MRWLAYDVEAGHPNFSQLVRCDVCGTDQQQTYLAKLSGLSGEMLRWTLDTTTKTPGNAGAYDAIQSLVDKPSWFITLHGTNGVGKTRLLTALVNAGRRQGWKSVYMTTAGLLDHLRSAYAPGRSSVTFDGVWDKIVTAKILVMDEVDRWSATAWAQEKFFELIDHRYRNGLTLLTGFATNNTIEDMPPYLSSRIQDHRCQIHEITGQDMRRVRV